MSTFRVVALSSVSAPSEPLRHALDRGSLDELRASVLVMGLIEPLIVKEVANGYEVVAGHRRLLACRAAGLATVPVLIRADETDVAKALMIVENLQRADLTPVEEARAITAMRDVLGRSLEQIALSVSRSEAWVRGRLELLLWPAVALEALSEGRASVAALKPLMELENEVERDRLLQCAIESGASAPVTRSWAAQARGLAADSPETMGPRSQALVPLADATVLMPCYSCRVPSDAFALQVLRVCRPCIEELENAAHAPGGAAASAGGVA